eukprot:scaffold28538_cov17-Tisochrysis_lutea.AAC.1
MAPGHRGYNDHGSNQLQILLSQGEGEMMCTGQSKRKKGQRKSWKATNMQGEEVFHLATSQAAGSSSSS